jgi:RNA-directed DNA polymerase
LDAQVRQDTTLTLVPATAEVNGPEGEVLDWLAVDWQVVEDSVRRLRQRIFTATRAGDLKQVRNLQKLMLRSRANALVSVRRVTEVNAGRKTAGIDGVLVTDPKDKAELAELVQHRAAPDTARPVRRVFIPKRGSTKQRPIGIPVIADRCRQAVAVNALEPEWEARFEPKSYGFRPGRGCHDAIAAIFATAHGRDARRCWALDADLTAAFDRIGHDHLLSMLGTFPARDQVAAWLKAGVIDRGRFAATEEGTPQGGVISPVAFNIALHGMEQAAGIRYQDTGVDAGATKRDSPVLVRYADDFVVFCESREAAEQVKAKLTGWLAGRGLAFNEDKTRVVHLDDGLDFLGFTIRRHHGKLLIKPSRTAVARIKERLRTEVRALRGTNAEAVIGRLNPIIRGWAAYYRGAVSSKVYSSLDAYLWKLTYKWARSSHPNKPKLWVTARYFGAFNKSRNDRWVFGDRASGAYLAKFSWTRIVRHQLVKGTASPDDPALTQYWAQRRQRRALPPVDRLTLRLLIKQDGRCKWCGSLLLYADQPPQSPQEWEQWARSVKAATAKKAIGHQGDGTSDYSTIGLIHAACRRKITTGADRTPLQPAREPSGLA